MRRFLVSGSLIVVVVMISTAAALGGPRGTFSYEENGRAPVHQGAAVDVQKTKDVVVTTVVFEPGFKGLWPPEPSDMLVVVKKGALAAYLNCTDKEMWDTGHAYYHQAGQILVKNEGQQPSELVAVFFNVAGKRPALVDDGVAGCAEAGAVSATEVSRAASYTDAKIDIEAGKQIVVQSFVVEPGFNFFWHTHPGPTIVLMKRGVITAYHGCEDKEVWDPGYAYHHAPGHHGHSRETAKNEGEETSEFSVVFFNVPEWHPSPVVPRDVQPPYEGCPTRSL